MPLNSLNDSGNRIDPPPDAQRTTLGVDVLSRFVCNTWDEATNNGGRPFDAVVIGAGMFGGYCANEIYRAAGNLRVLVLDAGAFLIPTHLQNLPRNIGLDVPGPISPSASEASKARAVVWGMPWRSNVEFIGQPYCIGGKSLYWGGWCPRLLPSDLEDWPLTVRKYLNRKYEKVERETGVHVRTDFIQGELFDLLKQRVSTLRATVPNLDSVADCDAEDSADLDPPLAVQGQSPGSGLFGFDKYSSVSVLIEAVRDAASQPDSRRRLFVVPNAHVKRLKAVNGVVTSIEVRVDGASKSLQIQPNCAVVLALGTIESTRLALASFPTSPGNPARELMGRNLMAHWRSNIFVRIRRSAFDPDKILPLNLQTAALLVRGSAPQGKFHIQVTASAAPLSASPEVNSDATLFSMIPDIDLLDTILANQQREWISMGFRGMSQLIGNKTASVPNPFGRWINLSPFDTDELGERRAYVQFNTTEAEDALADAMEEAILELARKLAGNNPNDLQITRKTRDGLGTSYHEAGTLWMGTDPRSSVTDTNGRFHHIANAFCADQSLFVTVGSANPALTGLVLARKVAEAVVARATGAPAPP